MRDGGGRGPEPLSAPVSSRGGSALGEPAGRRRRQPLRGLSVFSPFRCFGCQASGC
ncbi:phosphatase and tensin homolog, isoform CRA_c [Rattus norvegicus]|uniref:Phosphatase and tensin homolog, isoform CRA_c n=1 Tax=Rattus norvegicus TaxID=10116 RepID=A6I110_RAT|nr:phosphatase and tensin homolog, isoform CRA_c [Rattus norvegicus]